VYVLAGGAGFTGSIESVAELRAHVQAIRGPKPLPAWVFVVIDKLEEQDAEFPAKYSTANICASVLGVVIVAGTDEGTAAMHWVKYHEHADTLPANYVVLGDAWMRMNPVFGQGMAKALVEATTLDGVLRAAAGPAVGRAFFARAAARTGGAWTQTKIGDYAHDTCVPAAGETREMGARSRAFSARLGKRMLRGDTDLQRRMLGVRAWVLPATDMMAPSVLAKLALDWVRGQQSGKV
jgi:2-polyprenyl-6-methoxyphenol hydroxylase-like FAD-dependent oxidoreductase